MHDWGIRIEYRKGDMETMIDKVMQDIGSIVKKRNICMQNKKDSMQDKEGSMQVKISS